MSSPPDHALSPEIGKLLELLDAFEEQNSLAADNFAALERLLVAGKEGAEPLAEDDQAQPSPDQPQFNDDYRTAGEAAAPDAFEEQNSLAPDHFAALERLLAAGKEGAERLAEDEQAQPSPDEPQFNDDHRTAGEAAARDEGAEPPAEDEQAAPSSDEQPLNDDHRTAASDEVAVSDEHIAQPDTWSEPYQPAAETIENRFAAHIIQGMWKLKRD
jgi:hypothetical protein